MEGLRIITSGSLFSNPWSWRWSLEGCRATIEARAIFASLTAISIFLEVQAISDGPRGLVTLILPLGGLAELACAKVYQKV